MKLQWRLILQVMERGRKFKLTINYNYFPFSSDYPFRNHLDEKFDELQKLRIRVSELESELGIKKGFNALKFEVDHLFAVGSPLGIFLMLREHSPLVKDRKGADSLLPSSVCKRIHNVHHPSDPVVRV